MSEYTEAHREYVFNGGFMHWMPGHAQYEEMRPYFAGGYKIHLSADPALAGRVAWAVLPLLRDMPVHHKIVPDRQSYERLNRGRQQGKFITIYSGPLMDRFLRVTRELDVLLGAHGFKPGPVPYERLGGHERPEQSIGLTGLLFYTTSPDFTL